jgi:uncharacterized protein YjiS (DUF1127 family)
MGVHMPVQSERLAPDRSPGDDWGRIDPTVLVAEGRRLQARAMAEVIGHGWRGFRWGIHRLTSMVRGLTERLTRRVARNRAVHLLSGLDDRLLADIGLRRADIELAVDGGLGDPRMRRRSAMEELVLEDGRRALPAAPANSNRPVPPLPVPGLAA